MMEQRRAFDQLRALVVDYAGAIQHNAELVDELDLSMSFAQVAHELGYARPEFVETYVYRHLQHSDPSPTLTIVNGRHPSVEHALLTSGRRFTPNSTRMAPEQHLHIITGPNQGGKSTLLRQTAIIAILAQSGCFVPAEHATLGVVDRVFSRVGARDDLFRDRSTFMLEMVECVDEIAVVKHR